MKKILLLIMLASITIISGCGVKNADAEIIGGADEPTAISIQYQQIMTLAITLKQ